MVKVVTVVGARPQFIKAAPVAAALAAEGIQEVLVHTGQHYDPQMSDVFFQELGLAAPAYHLGVGAGSHGVQTGRMLERIEEVLLQEEPDWLLVYGDTNSTLAGALTAAKLHIPVAHVEAGLRSFNKAMPEEINRVMTDHVSDLLFCPTQTAVQNLQREGVERGVQLTGDVMYDAILRYSQSASGLQALLAEDDLPSGAYVLATVHRPSNTDDPDRLGTIISALGEVSMPVLWPIHPRTRGRIEQFGLAPLLERCANLRLVAPLGYLDMLVAERGAARIVTDSGGVQKEAHMLQIPCVTLRPETEWVETLAGGWNQLVPNLADLQVALERPLPTTPIDVPALYGDGRASARIADALAANIR